MLSGPFAIIFYAVEIFKKTGAEINQYSGAIITASMRIIGNIIAFYLVQKLPHVKHIMLTMSLMGISMMTLGVILYFKDNLEDSTVITVIPILSVSVYLFAYGAGMMIKNHNP